MLFATKTPDADAGLTTGFAGSRAVMLASGVDYFSVRMTYLLPRKSCVSVKGVCDTCKRPIVTHFSHGYLTSTS